METVLTVWKREKSLASTGIGTPARPVHSLVSIPTALSRTVSRMANFVIFTRIHEEDF